MRLIDADALIRDAGEAFTESEMTDTEKMFADMIYDWLVKVVESRPTIAEIKLS